MKTLFRLGVLLLLCGSAWGAITFHASSSNATGTSPTATISLPTVSNNDYVVCSIQSWQPATPGSTNLQPFAAVAGWTNLLDVGFVQILGQAWTTGASTTLTFTVQNGATIGPGAVEGCLSFTGVDTSTPVDGVPNISLPADNRDSAGYILYPSLSPAFTNDALITIGTITQCSGGNPGDPPGITNAVFRNGGPCFRMGYEILSSGNATGNLRSSPGNSLNYGIQLLLKAASGGSPATTAVAPTLGGIQGSCTDFSTMYPLTGDLIGVLTFGAGTGTTISGFTKVFQTADVGFFTQPFTAGGSTTITLSGNNPGTSCETVIVRNYNPSGLTLAPPIVDAFGTTTAIATSTSLASASIAANSASDLLVVFWSSGNNTITNSNPWTLAGGLTNILTFHSGTETVTDGILQAPSNPTGTFTSTIATSASALGSGAVTFIIATGTSRKRGQVIQVN